MWMERSGWWVIELQRALAYTRSWTLINPGAVEPLEFAYDPGGNLDPPGVAQAYARILEGYEENLEGILERARDDETAVIWVTPVGNLSEYPVPKKDWGLVGLQNNRADQDAKPWALEYAQGIAAFREKRFDDAIAAFKRARDRFPRTRAPALLNERLRELDDALEDLHLVDFEAQLEEIGREEGIGCNFFGTDDYCDGVHPNPRTSRLIGESIANRIAELRQSRPQ
jgi:tetratricopeptide (TPR) repeat protein